MPEGPTPIEEPTPARASSSNTLPTVAASVVVVILVVVGSVVSNRSKPSHSVIAVRRSPSPSPAETPATPVSCTNGWHMAPNPVVNGDDQDDLVAASAVAFDDV